MRYMNVREMARNVSSQSSLEEEEDSDEGGEEWGSDRGGVWGDRGGVGVVGGSSVGVEGCGVEGCVDPVHCCKQVHGWLVSAPLCTDSGINAGLPWAT